MAKTEGITTEEVVRHARASRIELGWCAIALRQAAQEIDGFADRLETATPEELRQTAIAMNAAAVRATFSILTTRGVGERIALTAALLAGEAAP